MLPSVEVSEVAETETARSPVSDTDIEMADLAQMAESLVRTLQRAILFRNKKVLVCWRVVKQSRLFEKQVVALVVVVLVVLNSTRPFLNPDPNVWPRSFNAGTLVGFWVSKEKKCQTEEIGTNLPFY